MIIALDYDETFTKDPELWLNFIKDSIKRHHRLFIVTGRNETENEQIDRQLKGIGIRIFYTNYKAKKKHMNAIGIWPDIWIDDSPEYILKDYESIVDWTK